VTSLFLIVLLPQPGQDGKVLESGGVAGTLDSLGGIAEPPPDLRTRSTSGRAMGRSVGMIDRGHCPIPLAHLCRLPGSMSAAFGRGAGAGEDREIVEPRPSAMTFTRNGQMQPLE
jgi:hypothetical protein